jgi:hypothetical protein
MSLLTACIFLKTLNHLRLVGLRLPCSNLKKHFFQMKKKERKKAKKESVTFNDQGLRKLRKVSRGDIPHEVSFLSQEALKKTMVACELSRREGWKNFYDAQKRIWDLERELKIERSRARHICPICFGVMHDGDKSTEFCGHAFHKGCLEAYKQGAFSSSGEKPLKGCPLNCDE